MKRWLVRISVVLGALLVLGAVIVVSGVIPVKASSGHWAITRWVLHFAMQRSVATHSIGIDSPPLDDPRLVLMGAGHFEHGCRPCHGAPGGRMPVIPHHMTPHPPELPPRVEEYDDAELFHIVRHGVKFTGMPAWPGEHREDEVWAVVSFLRVLPDLDREGYRRLVYGELLEDPSPVDKSDAPEIVVKSCARCHGVDGLGRGKGAFPRLAGQRPLYLRGALVSFAQGTRPSGIMMPIARAMTEAQRREAVRWYAGLPPFSTAKGQAATRDPRGERIALQGIPEDRIPPCASCHGPGRAPHHPAYPRLAGQYAEYLTQQLELFARGHRGGWKYSEIMNTVAAHTLDPPEIRAVARYYAALRPAQARSGPER